MANLSITAGSVLWTSGNKEVGVAGAAITAGQPVYVDTANSNVIKLAGAASTALVATVAGVALHAAGTGQPISYATTGSIINIGATTAKGMVYYASDTAGAIMPQADVATSTWYFSRIGYATTTGGVFVVDIKNTGVVV
jgi:hypothetical protein